MNIIFLDIDGVLNNIHCPVKFEEHFFVMDEKLILLQELVQDTSAQLILTSTWRHGWYDILDGNDSSKDARLFKALKEKLYEYNLCLLSMTPVLSGCTRGEEIDSWLQNWDGESIGHYLILDDMNEKEFRPHASHLIRTSFTQGLLNKHMKKAKRILGI